MTVFFFVVGLEIKRELVRGELRDRRTREPAGRSPRSAGMVVPALLYLAVNAGGPGDARLGDPDGDRHRVRAGRARRRSVRAFRSR